MGIMTFSHEGFCEKLDFFEEIWNEQTLLGFFTHSDRVVPGWRSINRFR